MKFILLPSPEKNGSELKNGNSRKWEKFLFPGTGILDNLKKSSQENQLPSRDSRENREKTGRCRESEIFENEKKFHSRDEGFSTFFK